MWLYLLYFYLQVLASCLSLSIVKIGGGDTSQNNPPGLGAEDVHGKDDVFKTIASRVFDEAFKDESKLCKDADKCEFSSSKRTGNELFIISNHLESHGSIRSPSDNSKSALTGIFGKISPVFSHKVIYSDGVEMNMAVNDNYFDKSSWSEEFLKIFSPEFSSAVSSPNLQEKITGNDKGNKLVVETTSNFLEEDSIRQKRNPQSFSLPSFIPDIFSPTTQKTSNSKSDFPIKLPEIKFPFDMQIGRRKRQIQKHHPFNTIGNLEIVKDGTDSRNLSPSILRDMDVLESEQLSEKCPQKMIHLLRHLLLIYVQSNFDSEEIERILDALRSELLGNKFKTSHLTNFLFLKDKKSVTCIRFFITEFCRSNNLCTSSRQLKQFGNNFDKQISVQHSHLSNEIKIEKNIDYDNNKMNELINNNQIFFGNIFEKLLLASEKNPNIDNISNFYDDLDTDDSSSLTIEKLKNDYLRTSNLPIADEVKKQISLVLPLYDNKFSKMTGGSSGSEVVEKLENRINNLFNSFNGHNEEEDLHLNEGVGTKSDSSDHLKSNCQHNCQFSKIDSAPDQNDKNDQLISNDEQSTDDLSFSILQYSNQLPSETSEGERHNEDNKQNSKDEDIDMEGELLIQAEMFKDNNQNLIINNLEDLGNIGVEYEGVLRSSAPKSDLSSLILRNIKLHLDSHEVGTTQSDSNWQALDEKSRQIRSPYRTFYYRIPRTRTMKYQNKEKDNLEDLESPDINDSQIDGEEKDEEDKEVENIPQGSSGTSTTTTSTTTTSSSTTEDEFSGYDEDEEEECNKDILDIIFTTIKCFFNMISAAIIGIEFGANCCHQ